MKIDSCFGGICVVLVLGLPVWKQYAWVEIVTGWVGWHGDYGEWFITRVLMISCRLQNWQWEMQLRCMERWWMMKSWSMMMRTWVAPSQHSLITAQHYLNNPQLMEHVMDLPLRIIVAQLCIRWSLQHSCHVDFKSSDRQCMYKNLSLMSMTYHCNRGNKLSVVVSDTLHANMVTRMPPPLLSKIMPKHDKDVGDIGKKIADSQDYCRESTSIHRK